MNRTALIISLISIISALAINEVNLNFLRNESVDLRSNETVITADDASYISPAINYLKDGEFKNNMNGKGAYFLRPPGYSMLFVITGYYFNSKTSLQLIKLLQLLLFGISVYCLFFISYDYLESKKMAILLTSFYGISNISSGFIYYTLTEGITPALVILYVFFLAKAKKQLKYQYYYIAALLFSLLFITRPVLGILGLALPFYLFADYWKQKKRFFIHIFISGIIASSSMFIWQVRNWNITNEFVGLHPIYYAENSESCFRPTQEALWELCKGWGEKGSSFHSYIGPFWEAAINGKASDNDIKIILSNFPKEVVKELGEEELISMFRNYQSAILYQKYYYDNNLPMPKILPEIEEKTIKQLKALTSKFKKHFWFQYYFISPLKVFKELAFHSNLSLFVFQKTFRDNIFMEGFRGISFLIHSMAYLILILSLFYKKSFYEKSLFSIPLVIYIFYLIFIQRSIEERYTLPILSLVLINLGYFLLNAKKTISKILHKQ